MRAPHWFALRCFVILVLTLLACPLLVVVGVAFNPTDRFALAPLAPSLRWFGEFVHRDAYVHALFAVTLPVALCAAFIATVVGTLAAIALVRFRRAAQGLIESLFMLPILVPSLLLGAALYLLFARFKFAGGYTLLIVGHVLLGVPFVIRVVTAGLSGINPAIEDAAVNLGCNRIRAFWKVGLPLVRSSIVSGAIFAFILSFGDVNMALFLSGPNTNTLPLQIFSDIQWQGDPTIAAASTLQIVVVTALIVIAQRLSRRRLAF